MNIHARPIIATMDTMIQIVSRPCWKARAGSTSMVQPLVVDDPALSAVVMLDTLRPPRT